MKKNLGEYNRPNMPPKQKINGIAFHGSGGLLWYYMGIAQFIQDNYDTSELQFCGVSGGCLPGVFLSSQLSIKQIWEDCFIPWINDINELPTKGAILPTFTEKSMEILLKYLKKSITNEAEILKNINSHLSIRMTKLSIFNGGQMYINEWSSLEDIIDCVSASCWLPGIFGKLTKTYKGYEYMDGGFPYSIEDKGADWLHIKITTFQDITQDVKTLLYLTSLYTIGNVTIAQELYNLGYTDSHKNAEFFDGMSPIS